MLNDKIMKYLNIALAVIIAAVIAAVGVTVVRGKAAEGSAEALEASTEADTSQESSSEAVSYIDIPGWQDRTSARMRAHRVHPHPTERIRRMHPQEPVR